METSNIILLLLVNLALSAFWYARGLSHGREQGKRATKRAVFAWLRDAEQAGVITFDRKQAAKRAFELTISERV